MKTKCAVWVIAGLLVGAMAVQAAWIADVVVDIVVTPNTINIQANHRWVTVHADIEDDAVDLKSLALNDVSVAFTEKCDQGDLVAKFNADDVKGKISPPCAELTLTGVMIDGVTPFSGKDTVRVINRGGK